MTKIEWLRRLERRFGAWAFPDLAPFIVFMNAAIYVLSLLKPSFASILIMDPQAVMRGEFWRVFTFLFIPPQLGPLWMFFWLYLLYLYAQALEEEWGPFQFNLYYLIGALASIAVSLWLGIGLGNVYLNSSLFLAFATLYPDFELLLFFFLPVKIKWIAGFTAFVVFQNLIFGDSLVRWAIAAGFVNYAVFFGVQWKDFVRLRIETWRNRRRFRQ